MSTFEDRLRAHADLVDRFLEAEFDAPEGVPPRLGAAMRYAVIGGGKRFRPFLVIEAAALFGIAARDAVAAAGALECLHCYSLVHDDLPAMDNDRIRRGQPTVWAAFDEWTAILAGDALLTLSFGILARPATHTDPAVRGELLAGLAAAAGAAGMVGGQTYDLMSDKLGEPAAPTLDHIRRLQAMKTGALIRFACEAGAVLGCANSAERAALRSFGSHLGVVFQIADDLLDATGDSTAVGKAVGKDAGAGKATQVGLLGIAAAREHLAQNVEAARAELSLFGVRAEMMQAALTFAAERTH